MDPGTVQRRCAAAVMAGVPIALASIWLMRDRPAEPPCTGSPLPPGLGAQQEAWLAGAGPLLAGGVLLVLAATLSVRRPGPFQVGAAGLVGGYAVACSVDHGLVAVFAVPMTVVVLMPCALLYALGADTAGVVAGGSILTALAVLCAGAVIDRRPRCLRAEPVLIAAGWASAVVGVGGITTIVVLAVTSPLCLD